MTVTPETLASKIHAPAASDSRLALMELALVETSGMKALKEKLEADARKFELQGIWMNNTWSRELSSENIDNSLMQMLGQRFGKVEVYDSRENAAAGGIELILVMDMEGKAGSVSGAASWVRFRGTLMDVEGNVIDTFEGYGAHRVPFPNRGPYFLASVVKAVDKFGAVIDKSKKLKNFASKSVTTIPPAPRYKGNVGE